MSGVRTKTGPPMWLTAAAVGAYGALCLTLCYLETRAGTAYTVCTWKNLTGLPCPLCGSTRAALALLQGHLHSALLCNPLATCLYLLAAPGMAMYVLLGRQHEFRIIIPRVVWWGIGVLIAVNWAYLIHAGI